ncbi:MAG: phospholipid carrier-dependent glycosyltransferase [Anaerolineae bacterium]|nr:phospholipid carrier-dependent glycosyltransferase [Anaerolineae bacterium]
MPRPRLDLILLALVCAVALALRLSVLSGADFDGLYGQDAYAYADFGERLLTSLAHGQAPPPFYWPLGYPALLAAVFALGGGIAAAQAVGLLLGVADNALIYLLARAFGCRPWAAALAGLIAALGGQAIQSGIVLMSDVPALFWACLSALVLTIYLHQRRVGWLALAAVALAGAVVTRWLYLALLPVWAVTLIAAQVRLRHLGIALLCALPILLAQTAYSLNNPYPALDHPWVVGWSPANALRSTFDNTDGHFEYATSNAAFYAQPVYAPVYLSPLVAPVIAFGVYALMRRRQLPLILLALGWLLLPYIFLAGTPYQNSRFALIVVPAVALLAALGLDALLATRRIVLIVAALALCVFGLGQMLGEGVAYTTTFINRQRADKDVIAWAETQIPPGAQVYALGLTLPMRRYTTFTPLELYDQTPETLAAARQGADAYLLINEWQIEHQWRDLSPEIAVRWLRDERGLAQIGHFGYYTLYRVRP